MAAWHLLTHCVLSLTCGTRSAGSNPITHLSELSEIVAEMFPDSFVDDHEPLPSQARFQHAFAGFVTLADWLGSDETVFRFPGNGAPSGLERIVWAREQATALTSRRWIDPSRARTAATRRVVDFTALFPHLPAPRPAQEALLGAALPRPGQVIVLEAETGSGKTEAALIHFLRLFQAGEVDGLYFALPTRAAAVQIHRRIKDILSDWLGEAAPPVGLAVPGYLRVDDAKGQRLPDSHGTLWPDEDVRDRVWAVGECQTLPLWRRDDRHDRSTTDGRSPRAVCPVAIRPDAAFAALRR